MVDVKEGVLKSQDIWTHKGYLTHKGSREVFGVVTAGGGWVMVAPPVGGGQGCCYTVPPALDSPAPLPPPPANKEASAVPRLRGAHRRSDEGRAVAELREEPNGTPGRHLTFPPGRAASS